MGQSKAKLSIEGKTFLEHMIAKGRNMGFSEILISGNVETAGEAAGARLIPDVLKERGPLGGLYSCFRETSLPACFVISVDVPMISPRTIENMVRVHELSDSCATLLAHQGKTEPLIGVYNTGNPEILYEVIKDRPAAVFAYLDRIGYKTAELEEPLDTIANINTPAEYKDFIKEPFSIRM